MGFWQSVLAGNGGRARERGKRSGLGVRSSSLTTLTDISATSLTECVDEHELVFLIIIKLVRLSGSGEGLRRVCQLREWWEEGRGEER